MQYPARLALVAFLAMAFAPFCGLAMAQGPIKQIKLNEKHIEGFISAQKDMAAAAEKVQASPPTCDKVDPAIESVAKKHGFTSFCEYDDVAANISMVMAGIDPQSKQFTEPQAAIKKEIEEVKADKSIPEKEKKQMLEELNEALRTAQPIANVSNIDLVKKYWDKIDAVLQ
ncbi:MAG: hypothetical protein NW223_14575 [Hyphomicrobiaceae bacterium]|nr:hypothetical protein [Hyphomicrobiaceae bacterium]